MEVLNIAIIVIGITVSGVGIFLYWKSRQLKMVLKKQAEETHRRMYEIAILKELGERIGYSLNVKNIIDIITGSLHQLIEYSVVSYMLLGPGKIIFKVQLEKSVSREFIDEIKGRMLKSLAAVLDKKLDTIPIKEVLSGAILIEDLKTPVRSFFNIPIVIGEKAVGVLTVAHTEPGHYKEEEMTILYKITKQASQAVTKLQEVVKTEQRKLNAMVQSMTEGVAMTDKNYQMVVVNPAAKKIIGFKIKEEPTIFDFIERLGDKFDIRGKLEESIKLDKILRISNVLVNDKFYQIFISPVKSRIGSTKKEILGGVVIFHDITKEKEIEKMREDFTSMMVHELRSPLDNIKKMAKFLGESVVEAKERTEFVQLIYENSAEMLEMVNDMLDAAKLEAGKFEIHKTPTDIKPIIASRLKFYATSAQNAKIKIETQLAKNLPTRVDFDAQRISQVFNNLLSNALKFTEAGGKVIVQALFHKKGGDINREAETANIQWQLDENDKGLSGLPNSLVVAVTDTGIGIPKNLFPQIFNKFKQFQATAVSGDKKGTGLGLTIAKGIVKAHGGIIGLGSKEGAGSTFYFTIPIMPVVKQPA